MRQASQGLESEGAQQSYLAIHQCLLSGASPSCWIYKQYRKLIFLVVHLITAVRFIGKLPGAANKLPFTLFLCRLLLVGLKVRTSVRIRKCYLGANRPSLASPAYYLKSSYTSGGVAAGAYARTPPPLTPAYRILADYMPPSFAWRKQLAQGACWAGLGEPLRY